MSNIRVQLHVLLALLCCILAHTCRSSDQPLFVLQPSVSISRRQSQQPEQALRWDKNNFFLGTQPYFPYAAEFHPWRLPVPGLWRDILEKLKSQGYTAVSIYTHWALVMPSANEKSASLQSPANDLKLFLTIAKEVDMLVILRPGPYINAETTGGGFPGWVQNLESPLRVNASNFNAAWKPYMSLILDAAKPFQLKLDRNGGVEASGGTLMAIQVENEFQDTPQTRPYFDEIIRFYREQGITVPTTFNDIKTNGDFRNDPNLDVWGHDSYPMGFDCRNPTRIKPLVDYTPQNNFKTPNSILEFQGGSMSGWGGPDFEKCAQMTNSSFVRLFEKGILADGVKMKNNYMGYGGTNWGNLYFSDAVATSYDYGAGLDEARIKREKGGETNLLGSFLKTFPTFATSRIIKRGDNLGVSQQDRSVLVSELSDGKLSWFILRQSKSSSSETTNFVLDIGNRTIPSQGKMSITGRNSIIVPTNIPLSASGVILLYSTADVSFYSSTATRDVIFLHGDAGSSFEIALKGPKPLSVKGTGENADLDVNVTQDTVTIRWTAKTTKAPTVSVTYPSSKTVLLRLADSLYARNLQFPSLSAAGSTDALTGQGSRALVQGAYHIASASVKDGTVFLRGQLHNQSTIEVFGPDNITQMIFEGHQSISPISRSEHGSFVATFSGPSAEAIKYDPPALTFWKMQESLPERADRFQVDENWKRANLNTTPNAYFSQATTKEVLFASSYGFHSNGMVLFRGAFSISNASSLPMALRIETIGGIYSASSVYVNGQYLGSSLSRNRSNATEIFPLTNGILRKNNSVLIMVDTMGLNEHGEVKSVAGFQYPLDRLKEPRGINAFDFVDQQEHKMNVPIEWYVTGNQGGEILLDEIRGPLNEGGFYAERQGWHLPGFDDSPWQQGSPTRDGVPPGGARFFRTTITLDVPRGHDMPMAIEFGGPPSEASQKWRALVFVNGWQFGKRIADLGPQTTFPVPPGILDPNGANDIGILLWSLDRENAARIPSLQLKKLGVFLGAPTFHVNNPTYQQVRTVKQ